MRNEIPCECKRHHSGRPTSDSKHVLCFTQNQRETVFSKGDLIDKLIDRVLDSVSVDAELARAGESSVFIDNGCLNELRDGMVDEIVLWLNEQKNAPPKQYPQKCDCGGSYQLGMDEWASRVRCIRCGNWYDL